jgi:paraquat-inducible protein A
MTSFEQVPTAIEHLELTACHECDLLLREQGVAQIHNAATCPRCGAVLCRTDHQSMERSLALAFTALILLVIGNLYPIVGLNIQGQQIETTVFGAARQLWREDMPSIAMLLMATTVLIPLIELSVLVWLLLPLRLGMQPRGFVPLFKAFRLAHPWAMVEVFILGVLVALVKLSHLADVLPGTAIWCFGLLMLVLTALSTTLNPRVIWNSWEASKA